ncbi:MULTISPECIES: hypothetical protein [Cellulosimicrobium]|uniref:hypothetical protein n=1 Tax=Cellulosimicrobium TaxID=157920 RepID=UPI001BAAF522|nr:hypothetical protein [Cellulosimicrobium cellulans]QUC01890.1 hypothetical protein J5A69_19805 [Cellulosimicrobium cellulans]
MAEKSVEQLVHEALDLFDDPSQSVASHVRRAIRIATKRQDYIALLRLYPETFDFTPQTKIDHPAFVDAGASLDALVGAEEGERQKIQILMRFMRDRTPRGGSERFHALSIGQIEAQLQQVNEVIEHYSKVPENLTPIDTYRVAEQYDRAGAQALPLRAEYESTIERVKQAVHDILVDTERQIESGQRRPSIFERGQAYIAGALARRAPDALTTFEAAEDALQRGTPEDLSHALTSCRRMIKALADALYPATGEKITGDDGRERPMTDDAYNNRLLQFAVEHIDGSTHQDLVNETLKGLGNRLKRLNELSSKGVHDVVSSAEAETCLMWTYLTVADFLRIADGTSSRLQGDPATELPD